MSEKSSGGWPDGRVQALLGIELPLIQAPMAGASTAEMALAVSAAGGLGSLPCALVSRDEARAQVAQLRAATERPFNLNFFCHAPPAPDAAREQAWRDRLRAYYVERGLDPDARPAARERAPFDGEWCALVEELRPPVVSFHFGLPEPALVARVKAAGARVLASATTVAEARWLEARGCDAVIATGFEAGGHRGSFLAADMARQVGTLALVPQVADAVRVPVIAAGGIGDARGIVAAFALGAAGVLMGTAYLLCPEARIKPAHRDALASVSDDGTVITNVFSGRPARGIVNKLVREVGPLSSLAPDFPLASTALAPLAAAAPADFANLWAGQAAPLAKALPAGELTRRLAGEALALLSSLPRR